MLLFKVREKFGIKIPNTVKEVLLFDMLNGYSKWGDKLNKDIAVLKKLEVLKYFPYNYIFSNNYQKATQKVVWGVKI